MQHSHLHLFPTSNFSLVLGSMKWKFITKVNSSENLTVSAYSFKILYVDTLYKVESKIEMCWYHTPCYYQANKLNWFAFRMFTLKWRRVKVVQGDFLGFFKKEF